MRPSDGELAYTTALSLLQTMEQKGLVGHERPARRIPISRRSGATASSAGSRAGPSTRSSTGAGEYVARAPPVEAAEPGGARGLERMIAEAKQGTRRRGAGGGKDEKGGTR